MQVDDKCLFKKILTNQFDTTWKLSKHMWTNSLHVWFWNQYG